jgi:hypothetical protein
MTENPQTDDQKRDAVLKKMLNTPPKPRTKKPKPKDAKPTTKSAKK